MARTISIGNQSFQEIREKGYFFVDKTSFIKEWWDSLYILLVSAGNSQSFSSYFVTSISTFPSAKKEIPSASRSV